MGLDGIELIMDIEDEFGIEIPDHDIDRLETVGAMAAYVFEKVRKAERSTCRTAHTFYQVRRELMEMLGLPRRSMRPRVKVADLVPTWRRRDVWRRLRSVRIKPPRMELPNGVALAAILVVLIGASFIALEYDAAPTWGFLCSVLTLGVLAWLTARPFEVCLPSGVTTLGDLSIAATPMEPEAATVGDISHSEVATRLRQIISRNLNVPTEELHDGVEFARDLNVG